MSGYGGDINIAKQLSAQFKSSGGKNDSQPRKQTRQHQSIPNRSTNPTPQSCMAQNRTNQNRATQNTAHRSVNPKHMDTPKPKHTTEIPLRQSFSGDSMLLKSAACSNYSNQDTGLKQTGTKETGVLHLPANKPQNKKRLHSSRWNYAHHETAQSASDPTPTKTTIEFCEGLHSRTEATIKNNDQQSAFRKLLDAEQELAGLKREYLAVQDAAEKEYKEHVEDKYLRAKMMCTRLKQEFVTMKHNTNQTNTAQEAESKSTPCVASITAGTFGSQRASEREISSTKSQTTAHFLSMSVSKPTHSNAKNPKGLGDSRWA